MMEVAYAPGPRGGPGPTGQPAPADRPRMRQTKQSITQSFLERLQARGDIDIGVPGFLESICDHFQRLPTRYALDVNIDSLDVLSHKRLLEEARADPATVSFAARPVEVLHHHGDSSAEPLPAPAFPAEVGGTPGAPNWGGAGAGRGRGRAGGGTARLAGPAHWAGRQ
jgi:hypothetical protein